MWVLHSIHCIIFCVSGNKNWYWHGFYYFHWYFKKDTSISNINPSPKKVIF